MIKFVANPTCKKTGQIMAKNHIQVISILGCGWFGTPLAEELINLGFQIKGSTTSSDNLENLGLLGIKPYLINISRSTKPEESLAQHQDFFQCDVLLINIPPRRNTSEQHSFNQKIEQIAGLAINYRIPEIIFISSTSVYGDHNTEVNERSVPHPDSDTARILLAAENHLKHQSQFRTTIIRFGGLVGPQRNPGRFLSGKTGVANGLAPVNLIHLNDCIGITSKVIRQGAFGYIFNAVAPDHPSRETFYTHAARQSELPVPQFISELQQWKKVSTVHLKPLLNYSFQRPNWEDWI
jgi:nucleoside-diphosphate-sugar epimerase